MTVHIHVERVVVDGPIQGGRRAWREALARELETALSATPAGLSSGWPAGGQHLAELPAVQLAATTPAPAGAAPRWRGADPAPIGAALGSALGTGGRR